MDKEVTNTESEINLLDYYKLIRKNFKWIVTIVAICVVATGIITFFLPRVYESKAIILPIDQNAKGASSIVSSIGQQFGLSLGSVQSGATEVLQLLKSDILKELVIKKYNLLYVILEEPDKDKTQEELMWQAMKKLENDIMTITYSRNDNLITFSVDFTDAKIASNTVNYFLIELNDYMSAEQKRVAESNKKYLEGLIEKNSDPFIRDKIYNLIAAQVEQSMMAEVKENFAFKVLDPPRIPAYPIKPSLTLNLALSLVISFFLSVIYVFLREYHRKLRDKMKSTT